MRRRFKLLCLSLAAAVGLMSVALAVEQARAPSQAAKTPAPPASVAPALPVSAPAKAPPVPLLWKVSDGENAVYLLGSFHLLKADDYPLSNDIDQAFDSAGKVVFEVPPEQMMDPAMGQKFLAAAGYADGRTLTQVLPPALREKFKRILAQRGVSIAQFDGYEPWFVNLSLMLGVSEAAGLQPPLGLDQSLMRRAAEARKPTGGLETLDMQLQTLDRQPLNEQIAALKRFLDNPQLAEGELNALHSAWRAGDVLMLDKLAREELQREAPESYDMVNVQRNKAWVEQIGEMLRGTKQITLVVVGAMHLVGTDGLVERLRARGYSVVRICTVCDSVAQ